MSQNKKISSIEWKKFIKRIILLNLFLILSSWFSLFAFLVVAMPIIILPHILILFYNITASIKIIRDRRPTKNQKVTCWIIILLSVPILFKFIIFFVHAVLNWSHYALRIG